MLKEQLRELKKVSRGALRRVREAEERPKLLAHLLQSLNISQDFVARMKNLTDDLQVFTEVEINKLESLANETEVGVAGGSQFRLAHSLLEVKS